MARVAYLTGRSYRGTPLGPGVVPPLEEKSRELILAAGKKRGVEFEVVYWDAAMEHVSTVRPGSKATVAGPEGIRLGNTVTDVEAANGTGFDLSGFGWDYGGYVRDWRGGKLAAAGDCVLGVRFTDAQGEAPAGMSGDGVTVKSEGIRSWNPQVSEISVGWPLPAGVTPQ